MEIWQQALLIGLVLGGVLAIWIIPRSLKNEPVRGGTLAELLHGLAVVLACAVFPAAIAALVLRGGFGVAFPVAFGMAILAFLVLIVFAIFEQPAVARAQSHEDVWTAEKAKTSGL
ncbi:MAG: hypothetical protein IPK19_33345 [Chloroflexi bacterium]|nr:hypothetical protein [Chloroflexota bacterium]